MCNTNYLLYIYIAVECDHCELWAHIKCNNLNYLDYRFLQKSSNVSWYCIEFWSTIVPFNPFSSNRNFFACCANTDNNRTHWIDLENDHNSSLSLKSSSNLELLVKQFGNATPDNSNDPENVCSSKCYDFEEMHNIEIPHKINHSPCFIQMHVLLIKILMTFINSWIALKFFWHNSNKWNKNHKHKYLY